MAAFFARAAVQPEATAPGATPLGEIGKAESLKVKWTDALSTGNKAIDNQHRFLIDIVNDLAEAIETGKAAQKIQNILNLLQYYTEWHFCREEQCMERTRCPSHEKNKAAHAKLIETFLEYRKEFTQSGGSMDIALRLYKTLTNWLVQHIQGIDAGLRDYSANDVTTSGFRD